MWQQNRKLRNRNRWLFLRYLRRYVCNGLYFLWLYVSNIWLLSGSVPPSASRWHLAEEMDWQGETAWCPSQKTASEMHVAWWNWGLFSVPSKRLFWWNTAKLKKKFDNLGIQCFSCLFHLCPAVVSWFLILWRHLTTGLSTILGGSGCGIQPTAGHHAMPGVARWSLGFPGEHTVGSHGRNPSPGTQWAQLERRRHQKKHF